VYYNRALEELKKSQARAGNTSTASEELRLKRVDFNLLEEADANIRRKLERALLNRTSILEQMQKLRLALEEDRRQQEGLLDSFFSRAFPDLPAVVANILNHLDAGHGCLVCGTPTPKRRQTFRELANQGICPFCETKNVRTEQVGALSSRAEEEIRQLDARIEEKRNNLTTLEQGLKDADDLVETLYEERAANGAKLLAAEGEAQRLEASLPPSQEELDKKRGQLDSEAREMKNLKLEITRETKRYSTLLAAGRKSIEKMAAKLTSRFEYYAGGFLAEKCKLTYREERRRLGEEGDLLSYPNFHVNMTSAVSPQIGTPRTEDTQVSESQGGERDLMLFSLCGGPGLTPGGAWFLGEENKNQFNVAVSRARAVLHIFGNREWAMMCGLRHIQQLAKRTITDAAGARRPGPEPYQSPWEKVLAEALVQAGISVVPQYPIAGRFLDLAILKPRKIDLEVDGESIHRTAGGGRKDDDYWRDLQLQSLGWKVCRFWVYELREDLPKCVRRVSQLLRP
jgi:very-short-patch-repair endonuclease